MGYFSNHEKYGFDLGESVGDLDFGEDSRCRFALDIDLDAPKVRIPLRAAGSSKCSSHFLLDFVRLYHWKGFNELEECGSDELSIEFKSKDMMSYLSCLCVDDEGEEVSKIGGPKNVKNSQVLNTRVV